MKSSCRHTVQRDPAPAFPKWRETTLSAVPPLIDVRSTPRAGLGASHGHSMLACPALWRWRKHALFPPTRWGNEQYSRPLGPKTAMPPEAGGTVANMLITC